MLELKLIYDNKRPLDVIRLGFPCWELSSHLGEDCASTRKEFNYMRHFNEEQW